MVVKDLLSVHAYTSKYPADRYGSWLGGTDPASVARYIADTVARYGRPPKTRTCPRIKRQQAWSTQAPTITTRPSVGMTRCVQPYGTALIVSQKALAHAQTQAVR